jgi:hypothetical protein
MNASVDIKNEGGDTPLHLAVMEGRSTAVKVLFKYGASPDIHNQRSQTVTGMIMAGRVQYKKFLENVNRGVVKESEDYYSLSSESDAEPEAPRQPIKEEKTKTKSKSSSSSSSSSEENVLVLTEHEKKEISKQTLDFLKKCREAGKIVSEVESADYTKQLEKEKLLEKSLHSKPKKKKTKKDKRHKDEHKSVPTPPPPPPEKKEEKKKNQ